MSGSTLANPSTHITPPRTSSERKSTSPKPTAIHTDRNHRSPTILLTETKTQSCSKAAFSLPRESGKQQVRTPILSIRCRMKLRLMVKRMVELLTEPLLRISPRDSKPAIRETSYNSFWSPLYACRTAANRSVFGPLHIASSNDVKPSKLLLP
jgi:hypothetical protein